MYKLKDKLFNSCFAVETCFASNSCTLASQGWGNEHFNSQAAYMNAVLIILFDSVCAQNLYIVRKLVRPWPDLPGWFPQPCIWLSMYQWIYKHVCMILILYVTRNCLASSLCYITNC